MITEDKIKKINQLAKKAKTVGLTEDEKELQAQLRKEYIQAFRGNLKAQLDSIRIMDKDGNITNPKKSSGLKS